MSVSKETLAKLLQEFSGPRLNDEELEKVLPAVEVYVEQARKLRQLDLSKVLPARLPRANEGGTGV